jgi:hypothetical protein
MAKILLNLVNKYIRRNSKVPKEIMLLTNSCPKNEIQMYYDYFVPQVVSELNKMGGEAAKINITIVQVKDLPN